MLSFLDNGFLGALLDTGVSPLRLQRNILEIRLEMFQQFPHRLAVRHIGRITPSHTHTLTH
jgi:hypothetical protein